MGCSHTFSPYLIDSHDLLFVIEGHHQSIHPSSPLAISTLLLRTCKLGSVVGERERVCVHIIAILYLTRSTQHSGLNLLLDLANPVPTLPLSLPVS